MMLPDLLVRIGDYTPPGVQALLDAWSGTVATARPTWRSWAVITVLAGAVSLATVPLGMTASPAPGAPPPAPSPSERWGDGLTDWCPYVTLGGVVGPGPRVVELTAPSERLLTAGLVVHRRALGVPRVTPGRRSPRNGAPGPDDPLLHRPAGDRVGPGPARVHVRGGGRPATRATRSRSRSTAGRTRPRPARRRASPGRPRRTTCRDRPART